MPIPFQNCLVAAKDLSAPRVRELLEYHHELAYTLLDLKCLETEMLKLAEEKVAAQYLVGPERVYLEKFSSAKRKREWLGGRFAAKYAAAGVLGGQGNAMPSSGPAVLADENGRPFLAAAKKKALRPDISISHSCDLAAAMAVSQGLCGIDIQKVTDRVVKVRDRFCTPDENGIIRSFFRASGPRESTVLTKLWAAKESLRKAAGMCTLPGFLELELKAIDGGRPHKKPVNWRFIFQWQHIGMNGMQVSEICRVAVCLMADYALALTIRNDTVA